jgi:hypothetical protein
MKAIHLIIGMVIFSFFGCQNEEIIIEEPSQDNLSVTSPLTNLLSRVSQNPTSQDNILDNSDCFSVVLPVTVIVNNQQITVTNIADYALVQNAITQFTNDDDIVNFVYPITIQFQNFQTVFVQNADALDDIVDTCGEDNDGFDEIDCVQLVYPLVINVYNTNNQLAQTATITSNVQLFNFISNLNSNLVYAIQFPISVINTSGQTITITNNNQLQDFIDDAIDDCGNNSGGGPGNPNFTSVITNGIWKITYFFDDTDQTNAYNSYNFTFNNNGTSIAVNTSNNIGGTWSNYLDSGVQKFELSYNGLVLDEIEEDWQIIEFTTTVVRLKNVSGGNGGTDFLTFTKQ